MSDLTKELKEKLFLKRKNGLLTASEEEITKANDYCEGYKNFLNSAKTEREAVKTAVALAEKNGFTPFDRSKSYKSGDKVYFNNRGKTVAFAVIGEEPCESGINITAAHIVGTRFFHNSACAIASSVFRMIVIKSIINNCNFSAFTCK